MSRAYACRRVEEVERQVRSDGSSAIFLELRKVPHNGNMSNGRMFALADMLGNPLTRDYAERRSRWEPLMEVTQSKGDGETHPFSRAT